MTPKPSSLDLLRNPLFELPVSEGVVPESSREFAAQYLTHLNAQHLSDVYKIETLFSYAAHLNGRFQDFLARLDSSASEPMSLNEHVAEFLNDPEMADSFALYRALLLSLDTPLKLHRSTLEEQANAQLSSLEEYSQAKVRQTQLRKLEEEESMILRRIFQKKTKGTTSLDFARLAMVQDRIKAVGVEFIQFKKDRPEVAARLEYDLLVDYATQLRTTGFIFTESQKLLVRDIAMSALQAHMFLLEGETGVGKTTLVKALAQLLTGKSYQRAVGGGAETPLTDLLYSRHFDGTSTGYGFHPLLQAMTGLRSDKDETPDQELGEVYLDDEGNDRPPHVQRSLAKFVAEAKPGTEVAIPETALPSKRVRDKFLYFTAQNPENGRYKREKTGIETRREFGNRIFVLDYFDQTPERPDLFRFLLAHLMNLETQRYRVISSSEMSPSYKPHSQTGEIILDTTPTMGGFLWRFANAWKQLFESFSRKRTTVLHAQFPTETVEKFYLKKMILAYDIVGGWLTEFFSQEVYHPQGIENFFKQKLRVFLSSHSPEDRELTQKILTHFHINLDAVSSRNGEEQLLDPIQIGFMFPSVPRPKMLQVDTEKEHYRDLVLGETGEVVRVLTKLPSEVGSAFKLNDLVVSKAEQGGKFSLVGVHSTTGELVLRNVETDNDYVFEGVQTFKANYVKDLEDHRFIERYNLEKGYEKQLEKWVEYGFVVKDGNRYVAVPEHMVDGVAHVVYSWEDVRSALQRPKYKQKAEQFHDTCGFLTLPRIKLASLLAVFEKKLGDPNRKGFLFPSGTDVDLKGILTYRDVKKIDLPPCEFSLIEHYPELPLAGAARVTSGREPLPTGLHAKTYLSKLKEEPYLGEVIMSLDDFLWLAIQDDFKINHNTMVVFPDSKLNGATLGAFFLSSGKQPLLVQTNADAAYQHRGVRTKFVVEML